MIDKVKKFTEDIDLLDNRYKTMENNIKIHNEIEAMVELMSTGTYYNAYHKIHIEKNDDILKRLIVGIHECAHAFIGETFVGYVIGDYYTLVEFLIELSSIKKLEYFEDYLTRLGMENNTEKMVYIGKNALELDLILSQKKEYVEYLQFCVKVYYIVHSLHENSFYINEGFATYISLNFSEVMFSKLFQCLRIENLPEELKDELVKRQKDELDFLFKTNSDYILGYQLAEMIYEKFGEDGLILSVVAATNVPYFTYDLFSCSIDEMRNLMDKIYNCDQRWKNFYELDVEYIKKAINDPSKYMLDICSKICKVEEFPVLPKSYDYTYELLFRYGFMSSTYKQKIKLLGEDYYNLLLELIEEIVEDKDGIPNMDKINTVPYFYETANIISKKVIMEIVGINNNTDKLMVDSEMFERQSSLKRAINTIKYILKYSELYGNNQKLKDLANNNEKITEQDREYIRTLIIKKSRGV